MTLITITLSLTPIYMYSCMVTFVGQNIRGFPTNEATLPILLPAVQAATTKILSQSD